MTSFSTKFQLAEGKVKKFNPSRYQHSVKIGEGSYGMVYKAFDSQQKKQVALKKVKLDDKDSKEGLPHYILREISIMSGTSSHKNIIKLQDIFWDEKGFILQMEYADKGDLLRLFTQADGKLSFTQIRNLFREILQGVQMTSSIQSLWYRAPEALLGNSFYSSAVDCWSLGIILHELIHKTPMYPGTCEIDTIIRIFRHQGTPQFDKILNIENYTYITKDFEIKFPKFESSKTFPNQRRDKVPENLLKIVSGMTTIDPMKRMSCQEALEILGEK
ncbi:cyclin-dependent kinase 1 isoform 2 [Stylonychia lemnae]|uniref:Cyclin-dependent kinase 2 homolog n=1 Tax=Stylonychia lemnae TaxID=5949 RepID=A0A078B0V2_STYLE|nr:cyclin-dependent kinase 1 isoform 2 [Stylonychia lemnae]|eukprot:CDW88184.1 cyclin-dependent kinase 1 isoform 2 [Stylonychia lemnae]